MQLACRRSFPGPWTSFTKITGLSKLFPNSKLFAKYNLTYLDENKTYEVDAISGSFMMMRREVYEKTKGFDPQFFMYGEDLDLCYRTQQEGYKVYYVHATEIIHYKGESTKRSSLDETKVFYDAMHLFVRKHFSSFWLVEFILQSAIFFRKLFAFVNLYRLVLIAILFDFAIGIAAFISAEEIYSNERWEGFPEMFIPEVYIIPAFIQVVISSLMQSYKKEGFSVLRSIMSLIVGLLVITSMTFFFKQYAFSRAVVLIAFSLMLVGFSLWRIIAKTILKIGLSSNERKTRTIVVGTNEKAVKLGRKLKSSLTSFHNIIGLIGVSGKEIGENIENFRVVGSLQNIKKVIQEKRIDKVIFSSDEISFNQMFSVVSNCQGINVEFMVAGSGMDYLVGKSAITMLDDIPLLKVYYNISYLPHKIAKAIFDFIVSSAILLFVYPLIYSYTKLTGKTSEFINFILNVPKVFTRKLSFVGPEKQNEFEGLYLGKKGITGLWRIENIDKNDTEEKRKLDIFYAKNQNVWLDIEILSRTFSNMFIKPE
ncbi:MAG: sugar transferase [Melioribacteraceae bacterium]|nr:sugar transferase [Melioribacteraceae bacterium]